MAKQQLEKSAATHRERMEKAEAKLAHLRLMGESEEYRRLNRAKTSIEAALEVISHSDLTSGAPLREARAAIIDRCHALRTTKEA